VKRRHTAQILSLAALAVRLRQRCGRRRDCCFSVTSRSVPRSSDTSENALCQTRTRTRPLDSATIGDRARAGSAFDAFSALTEIQPFTRLLCGSGQLREERASNENTNGLLRQYFPKGFDFSTVTGAELDAVADELNERPCTRGVDILLAVPRVPPAALAVLSVLLAVVASLVLGADVGFALVIGVLVGVVASRQTRER
jgi:hypothetical protein